MDSRHFFDLEGYFSKLCAASKLAQSSGFHFCTCSGIQGLEGPLMSMKREHAFFCVDDTTEGSVFRGRSGGYFVKRTATVFLLHRYKQDDMADRSRVLTLCRQLFQQVLSRILIDSRDLSNEMVYAHTENVLCRELGADLLDGCTGLYFMLEVSEPISLKFEAGQWTR